ncbi:DNA polymerase III subunit beta [Candidatus Peregrinibacteria bacterium CG1_02_54_53]|nr:MAG: DNA polymerase III subunit beta [Candidatus Peregrinibacteria bacterium CG1_02_54_53]
MKLLCKTSDLLQSLTLVSRAISGQQALPILGNILLEAEGKRCKVSATDLELSIVTSFEASIENEGSITVPAKAILNFAQYNSDQEVLLETSEGTQLKCTSKHAKTLIAGEAATEYPTITPIEKQITFTLDAIPLLDALHRVTFASTKTSLRPVLSGVYLHAEKGHLTFVATDSYRLSEYKIPTKASNIDISCIVPTKVLEELRSILSSRKPEREEKSKGDEKDTEKKSKPEPTLSPVEVALSSQQIELHIGATHLLSRLIDGRFPDYKQIIPKEQKSTIHLSVRELTPIVKRMHYFAKEINNNLTFNFSKESVHVKTPQTQAGRDEATFPAKVKGEANKIALSSSYLLDFLSHADGEGDVELTLTDSMHPAVFRFPSNPLYLHLIMPLRLQEE